MNIKAKDIEGKTITDKTAPKAWDRRLFLKIKIKSLAAEAKIIKQEERKRAHSRRGPWAEELRSHRIAVVRFECRATHLAYGFIRGKTYSQIEGKSHPIGLYNKKRLIEKARAMVDKYGKVFDPSIGFNQNEANHKALLARFDQWVEEGGLK